MCFSARTPNLSRSVSCWHLRPCRTAGETATLRRPACSSPITVLGPGLVANQHRCCRQLDWTLSLRRQELTSEEMLYLMPKGPPATGFATRVSFEGRFVPGARTCWISFPARYAPCWDALGSESATDSVACIFQAEEYGPDLRHSIQSSFIKQRGCR